MEKKANLKEMTLKEKIGYIKDYYWWAILLGILAIVLLVGGIRYYITYKDPVVRLVLVNANTTDVEEPDFSEFLDANGFDKEKERIDVNTGYVMDIETTSTVVSDQFQALVVLNTAGGVDVIAINEREFSFFGDYRGMTDLREVMPEDFLEEHEEDLVYSNNIDTDEPYVSGLRLDDDNWLVKQGYYKDDVVLGFGGGCKDIESARKLFYYIIGE